jgi:hypothetical protein
MTFSRRRLLMAGAGLTALAPILAGCNPTDGSGAANAQNNTVGDGGGAAPPATPPPGGGGEPTARIRYDVASERGQAMLKIYAGAVAAMMARPEGDPLNWEFQWYSHWVKGELDTSGKTSETARIYGSVPSAAHSLALKMWDGCQAHGPNEDEDFFLPWHRMYVWAFENIIRSVSGNATFTLPYWDYTNPSEFAIPPQFRMQNDATYGALYRAARNAGVNAGQPIADANSLNLSILSEQSYSANGADSGFCEGLDNGLHGAVHVSVGNATDGMGVVPWAANDPIFWLHHCNIDRIWASWNAVGNANPTDPTFLGKPFPFADPNGAEIDYVVSSFLDTATVGYSYDQLAGGAQQQPAPQAAAVQAAPQPMIRLSAARAEQGPTPPVVAATAQPQTERLTVKGPAPRQVMLKAPPPKAHPLITHVAEQIALGRGALRVELKSAATAPDATARAVTPLLATAPRLMKKTLMGAPATGAPMVGGAAPQMSAAVAPLKSAAPQATAPLTAAPGPGQHTFIVISDLSTTVQPGVLYSVYLEAPRAGGAPQQYLVGSLNFFSAMAPGMSMSGRKVSFDITELAKQLSQEGRLSATPAVSFVPNGKPPSQAQPLIGSVSLVVQ